MERKNITNQRFGKLITIRDNGVPYKLRRVWFCHCDCGNTTEVTASHLISGHTKSCGCYAKECRKGENNPKWMGGAKNRGSLAWARKRLSTLNKECRKRGTADIKLTEQELIEYDKNFDGCCEICGIKEEDVRCFHLDHDHNTGVFRGMICFHCNAGLGQFKDNVESLQNAIKYLNKWNNSGVINISSG